MSLVRKRKVPSMNIIPLVDVLIVLIFFFLVTMQMRDASVLNLTLPEVETAGKNRPDFPIVIAIDADTQYYLNRQKLSIAELSQALEVSASVSKDQAILLVAHETTPLKEVTAIMDLCRGQGLSRIKLQSR